MKWFPAFFLLITMAASPGWARPEVVFPTEAEVSNTKIISVFQVAELKDLGGSAFREIAKMPLADILENQETLTLSGEEISKKLRVLVRENELLRRLNPSFKIPSEIRIRIRQDGFSKSELENSLRNVLRSRCESCEFQITLNNLPSLIGKNWQIDWEREFKFGSFMIPVQEENQSTRKWITGLIRVKKNVPVPKKIIRFGERLQAEDLEMAEVDITYVKEEAPDLAQVVGMIANRTLTPRSAVLLSDLKREPAARRGQVVKAMIGDENFEISVSASAEENGFVGDLIKIKNTETQKVMSAIVIEKGVVKVQ